MTRIKMHHAGRLGETKTDVVVPVAVRRTGVPRFVVSITAADHRLAAFRSATLVNMIASKITCVNHRPVGRISEAPSAINHA